MGIRKRIFDWCPQPVNPISTMLRRYFGSIVIVISTSMLLVSFFMLSSGSLMLPPTTAPRLPLSPTELWSFTASNSTANNISLDWSKPLVANGIIYLCTGESYIIPDEPHVFLLDIPVVHKVGAIYALNESSGAKLWNITSHGGIRSLSIIDDVLYVSASDSLNHNGHYGGGSILALDAVTGAQKWSYSIDGDITRSSINDGMIYVFYMSSRDSGFNSYVCAVNTSNGKELWRYNAGYYVWLSFPTFDEGAIYFGTNKGNYTAVNTMNGTKRWSIAVDGRVSGSSTLFEGIICFKSDDTTYALNAQTGEKLWSYSAIDFKMDKVSGNIYVNAGDTIFALDVSNGNKVWNYSANGTIISSLSFINDVIYFCTNGTINALNPANGVQLWSHYRADGKDPSDIDDGRLNYPFYRPNTTINDGVLHYYSGGTLFALDASNGNSLWNYAASSNLLFLTVANSTAFFYADNTVYALSVPPPVVHR